VFIKDLHTPHLIKRGRIKLSKPIAIILAIIFLALGFASVFIFLIPNLGAGLSRRTYYILTLGTTTNLVQAENLSTQVKNGGGGGFIINDGIFHVTAAVYKDRLDAESVAARMMNEFDAEVLTINIPRKRIRGLNTHQDNRSFRNILLFSIELVDFIVYQNLKLDTNETTDSAIIYLLNTRLPLIKDNIIKLENLIYQHYQHQFLINTLEFYLNFYSDFYYMISIISGDGLVTHRLKYFAVKYILKYSDLIS